MCSTWQLSVPLSGLTCSDQRQPGSNVPRPIMCPLRSTSSTCPLPSLNGRTSSGDSNPLPLISAMVFSLPTRTARARRGSLSRLPRARQAIPLHPRVVADAAEAVAPVDAVERVATELAGVEALLLALDDGVDVPGAARLRGDSRRGRGGRRRRRGTDRCDERDAEDEKALSHLNVSVVGRSCNANWRSTR